jgi:hypothetical protein
VLRAFLKSQRRSQTGDGTSALNVVVPKYR